MSEIVRSLRPITLRQWGKGALSPLVSVETSVHCPFPLLLDEVDHQFFLGTRARQSHYGLKLDASGLDVVSNALVVGPKLIVVSEDDHVFFETYWDLNNLNDGRFFRLTSANPASAVMRQAPVSRRIERGVLLGNPMSGNYHHWIINCLPRLRVARAFDDWPVIVQGPLNRFQQQSLAALNVKHIELFDGGIWQVGELVIPGNGVFAPSELSWVHDELHRALEIKPGPRRRLYISREDALVRRVTNEPELAAVLKRFKIQPIVLSELSLRDQVQAFGDAHLVVGPHGAGLTNVIFGKDPLTLLELHPSDQLNACFWLTASAMGRRYAFLSGTPTSTQRDMIIDPQRLGAILERIL